ncbi:MAG: ferrous iron transport protein B [Candidatus Zixiibacteriota bacterium]
MALRTVPTTSRTTYRVALVGNPNSGKTTLFNALTGLRQKVANYPGVTVEKRTGLSLVGDIAIEFSDLPGTYSLIPRSPDEAVASEWLAGRGSDAPPQAVVCVVDVTNLSRHLYLVSQIIDLGHPVVVALTMGDEAAKLGIRFDAEKLSRRLGVPVVEVVASENKGIEELKSVLAKLLTQPWTAPERPYRLPPAMERQLASYKHKQSDNDFRDVNLLLCASGQHTSVCTEKLESMADDFRSQLGIDEHTIRRFMVEARYAWQRDVAAAVVSQTGNTKSPWTRRLDSVLLNRWAGPPILLLTLGLIFQSIFAWSELPMEAISWVTAEWLPSLVNSVLTEGPIRSLINDGVLAGVGSVIVFLPQILLLFLFLTLLEDTGYMARAAFLLDRLMSRVGLSGRSFIPLLSSFACAVPGIMATRTIPNRRDRFATILVAPLMTCSARLVVYTLLIAAFVPHRQIWGPIGLQGLALLGLYLLGILGAGLMATIFRRTILRGPTPPLLMELPPFRVPRLRTLVLTLLERARVFLVTAGTIIFAASIVLWGLSSYPRWTNIEEEYQQQHAALMQLPPGDERAERLEQLESQTAAKRLRNSFAGYIGHAIEPVLKPLGFDWKIGIGILGSFAAREVFVSTMGVVYGVGSSTDDKSLIEQLRTDRDPDTGELIWTPVVSMSLLVFYAFALQCMSTVAVIRRETNSWRWPVFAFIYMGILAYGGAYLTRIIGMAVS